MSLAKIIVTGGAGYIGAHTTVELLTAGFEPILVDDFSRSNDRLLHGLRELTGKKLTFYQVDCKSRDALRSVFKQHPDTHAVIHFAAFKSVGESVAFPGLYYDNNIGSLLALNEMMREFGVNKLVFSSSCTVYGQPDQIPVTEEAPIQTAQSPYGATKQMCERILMDEVIANKNLRVVSLRYFNPIGAHPSAMIGELPIGVPNNLVPFITQTAIGKRKELTVFGNDYDTPDGSCLRDYIHVVDLAKAHVRALQYIESLPNQFEPINLGSGKAVSVLELIGNFMRVTGEKVNYTIGQRRPGDVVKVYADPRKSKELLHWQTELSESDALLHAWNWEKRLKA